MEERKRHSATRNQNFGIGLLDFVISFYDCMRYAEWWRFFFFVLSDIYASSYLKRATETWPPVLLCGPFINLHVP